MKNRKVIINIIIYIILIGVIISLIGRNGVIREKQIIKEMSESTQVSNLQNQINQLNSSQEEYAKNVQIYKAKIAEAITNKGVETSESAAVEELITNIEKIGSSNSNVVYYLGTGTSFNIKELLPNVDYTALTKNNFIVKVDEAYQYVQGSYISATSHNIPNPDGAIQASSNYNASTGIFNCSYTLSTAIAHTSIGYYAANKTLNSHVYLVVGDIIDITT